MKFIMVFLMSLLLAACSQQPSESDLKEAAKTSIKESNEEVKQMQNALTKENVADSAKKEKISNVESNTNEDNFGDALKELEKTIGKVQSAVKAVADPGFESMIYEFVDLQKLGDCEQQKESKKYKCKVKVTLKNKAGNITNTTDLMLIRSEGGVWVILDE